VEIVVTGIGLVSALGNSLQTSWQRLIAGQTGIQLYQPFPELAPRPLGLIGKQPAELATLTQRVVAMALEDAGLVAPLPDCGVVIGSSRSYQASWEKLAREFYRDAERLKSPLYKHLPTQAFLETLPHMNAIAAARQIGATGSVLAPMAACATGIWAIAQAASLLETGHCQRVIAGAMEAPITPLTLTGFQQMGALAQTGAYPFDRRREGLALGEGGAVLVLESAELAKRRSARICGQVLGRSAIAAVKQSCDRANLSPSDIDYIHAHGTATQLNDQNEAQLIEYLFPQRVPVSSTKGATGHTLGASGALGVAFSLMALKHQVLPPCVGLKEPEFDLDLVTVPRQSEIQQVLCFSFGFGGQNAVVALGKR
jgi:3-oxoacyl-[acyl-carrier-protein] synthase II